MKSKYMVQYNPHPQGKLVGDCVKRALTKATGKEYKEVSLELNRLKRTTGAKKFNSTENWKTYVSDKKWKKLSFQAIKGEARMNVERFCEQYTNGVFVLRLASHIVTVVNGLFYDTWDCSSKCVYNAWKVK